MPDLAHTWADPGRHLSCAVCGAREEFRGGTSVRRLIARLEAWERDHAACPTRTASQQPAAAERGLYRGDA